MNTSHLKFVKATAEFRSFSKAAQFCHVTQPTLSNGVSKLEEELGGKIFDRTTRSVSLTQFGESLLPTILSLLKLEEMIYLNAKEFSNPKTVVLKIGMSPLVSTKFVTLLTESFKAQNSKHEILLIEENLAILDEKLKKHELDLILVPVVKKSSSKNSIRLYDENLFLIDNADSPPSKVPINDIRDKTFVMVPDSCGLSEITRSLLRTTRKEVHEYEGKALSYQVLADWASNGLGSAILPKSKILPHIPKQQIFKSNKPVKISFEAKWLSKDNKPLKNMIQHFKNNTDQIAEGLAE
ncbi:MAG: LysR family transcriptional regulator [SAR86 cluster bacterium]|uniref:LysR family transcriptional regulator n=1 Tax=SAR86 cluster bacterium TaxID=2030880 RepID=A0A2A4X808_9GAMM|nr:MAG: LysR family transcriptional regulator [SAR86 cluster bacterium]